MKKTNIKTKLVVLALAILMILTFTACSDTTKNFLKNGWDHEANGYTFAPDCFAPGENENGELSFFQYTLKGRNAYGESADISGDKASIYPSRPATTLMPY